MRASSPIRLFINKASVYVYVRVRRGLALSSSNSSGSQLAKRSLTIDGCPSAVTAAAITVGKKPIKSPHRDPIHTTSAKMDGHVIQLNNTNRNMRVMEYAVRGPIVIRAGEIEKQLKEKVSDTTRSIVCLSSLSSSEDNA